MNKNRYLLPHKWQNIGLIAFILSFIAIFSHIVFSMLESSLCNSRLLVSILGCMMYLSLGIVLFSEEKHEDEYVHKKRLNAIAICAILCFAIILIMNIVQAFLSVEAYEAFKEWRMENFWNGKLIMRAAVLYWIIFKFSLTKRNR